MTLEFLALLGIIIAGFTAIFWYLNNQFKKAPLSGDNTAILLQNQINEVIRTLDLKLSETHKLSIEITKELTKVGEGQKQVVDFAKQLDKLQDILKNPKQRGVLGEYFLETVLKNVLPPGSYQMQYAFSDKVTVDAVVFIDKRIIPIDSKFSLENYNRILEASDLVEKKRHESAFINDLKNRIDETSKYVKPEEGTMDFAFMFIPSEAVYYDLLINKVGSDNEKNLIHYAGQKKVIVVSPTSFLAYLQTVLQGLKNQKISEEAREIIKQLENFSKHFKAYSEFHKKLGGHIQTTANIYNNASKELGKIDKDVLKITGQRPGIEVVAIEGPNQDE